MYKKRSICYVYYRNENYKINTAMHVDDIFMATTDKTRFMSWFGGIGFEFGSKLWVGAVMTKFIALELT